MLFINYKVIKDQFYIVFLISLMVKHDTSNIGIQVRILDKSSSNFGKNKKKIT